MATYLFDVSGATSFTSTTFLDTVKISIDGGTPKTLTDLGASISGTTATIPGYGTITVPSADAAGIKTMTLNLTAAAAAGVYQIQGATGAAEVTALDASAMTNAFTLGTLTTDALATLITGAGNDSIDASAAGAADITSITTGAGNDTVKAVATAATIVLGAGNDSLDATVAAGANITAGDGNDTLNLTAGTGALSISPVDLGAGDDAVTLKGISGSSTLAAVVYGGEGNDTFTADVNSNVTLTGGAGADTFVQAAAAATVKVTDYNYGQGDVIKALNNLTTVDKYGNITGTNVSGTAAVDGNIYKVKAINTTTPKTTEYWTAASGTSTAAMDLSKVTSAYVVDARGANAANVTVSSNAGQGGQVTFSTVASSANSLTVAKAGGPVTAVNFDENDVLNLASTATFDAAGNIVSGGTSVSGILAAGSTKNVSYTENGNTAAKKTSGVIGSTSAAAITLTSAALDKYVNLSSNDGIINASSLTGAQTFRLNNDEGKGTYTKINQVIGGVGGGVYVGANASGVTSSFNLGKAEAATDVWAGGTTGTMEATLGSVVAGKAAQDKVWFGTTTAQTNITSNFDMGFAATDDVVYLYDVANVQQTGLYTSGAGTGTTLSVAATTTAGANKTTLATNLDKTKGTQLKVEDAAGKVNYIAIGTTDAGGATIDADDASVKADYVIGKTTTAALSTVYYGNATASLRSAGMEYNVRLNNDALAATKYVNVGNADLSQVADDAKMVLVGTGAGSSLVAGGASAEIWGGGSGADHITLSAVAGATNRVWFGTGDGADVLATGIGTAGQKNTVYFYDQSLKTLSADYQYDVVNKKFVNKVDATNSLSLTDAVSSLNVQTTDATTKAALATAGVADLDYASDTALYIGNGTSSLVKASGASGATIRLNNDDGKTYYSGIMGADASGVTAGKVVLVGSSEIAATGSALTGGYGSENDYWGGSKSSDTFTGKDGVVDVAWFDVGDGKDTTTGFGKEDEVKLYNTTSIDKVAVSASGNDLVISVSNSDALTVTNGVSGSIYGADGITVALNDGSNYYVSKDATTSKYSLQKKA